MTRQERGSDRSYFFPVGDVPLVAHERVFAKQKDIKHLVPWGMGHHSSNINLEITPFKVISVCKK